MSKAELGFMNLYVLCYFVLLCKKISYVEVLGVPIFLVFFIVNLKHKKFNWKTMCISTFGNFAQTFSLMEPLAKISIPFWFVLKFKN